MSESKKSDLALAPAKVTLVKHNYKPKASMRPHIAGMLDNAYSILASQLDLLREKVAMGDALNFNDSKKLSLYIDNLVKLAKEERAQEEREGLGEKSDAELLELVEQARSLLERGQ